jgi:HD superfamily phosphohydrolase
VEAKGIYSVEKFLMARRFMYWQVYLHKTSLAAEQLLVRIIKRARKRIGEGSLQCSAPALAYFLEQGSSQQAFSRESLMHFARLDDVDILSALKQWQQDADPVLSALCGMILDRRLLSIKIQDTPFEEDRLQKKVRQFQKATGMTQEEASYFVFSGEISNRTYSPESQILILEKNGETSGVSAHSAHLNMESLSKNQIRYYICYPKKGV